MATQTQRNAETKNTVKSFIGKDEMNLCELPIARLGRRDKREVIEFTGEIVKNGKVIPQEWVVRGAAGLGLPTELAERVLVALISLAAADGFQSRKTTFTVYGLLKRMGLSICGIYYKEIVLALKRLHGVTITSQNTWWDNDKKKYRVAEKGFGLIDNYWLESLAEDEEETGTGGGYVIWNDWLWESFQAGYVKKIDTEFYYGLNNTLARRLYRFLDKRMHYQDSYQIDIFALAARLGMATYRYPSKVKEKLQPAFDELIARRYLVSAEVIKVGKYTRVKFVRVSAYQAALWEESSVTPSQTAKEGHRGTKAAFDGQGKTKLHESPLTALYGDYGTSDELKEIWQNILHECAGAMPSDSYQMIADSALLDIEQETATIAVDARNKDWIERQMRRKFLIQLSQYLGVRIREIRFIELEPIGQER